MAAIVPPGLGPAPRKPVTPLGPKIEVRGWRAGRTAGRLLPGLKPAAARLGNGWACRMRSRRRLSPSPSTPTHPAARRTTATGARARRARTPTCCRAPTMSTCSSTTARASWSPSRCRRGRCAPLAPPASTPPPPPRPTAATCSSPGAGGGARGGARWRGVWAGTAGSSPVARAAVGAGVCSSNPAVDGGPPCRARWQARLAHPAHLAHLCSSPAHRSHPPHPGWSAPTPTPCPAAASPSACSCGGGECLCGGGGRAGGVSAAHGSMPCVALPRCRHPPVSPPPEQLTTPRARARPPARPPARFPSIRAGTAALCARWRRCRWRRTSPWPLTRAAGARAASSGATTSRQRRGAAAAAAAAAVLPPPCCRRHAATGACTTGRGRA